MLTERINSNADKLYAILSLKKELNLNDLRRLTKLGDRDIFLALGWLTKDSKVLFLGDEKDFDNGNIHLIHYKFCNDVEVEDCISSIVNV